MALPRITGDQARPGDVVKAPGDDVFPAGIYQAPDPGGTWFSLSPTGAYGAIPHPEGELILLVRDDVPLADSG